MGGVYEDFEEGVSEGFVGGFDKRPGFGDICECLELDASEKFEMPGFDAASYGIRFADDTSVELDELGYGCVEGVASKCLGTDFHPLFEGSG